MIERGEHGLGQAVNNGVRNRTVTTSDDPGDEIGDLAARAGSFFDGRGGHAAGHDHAAEEGAHQSGDRVGVKLLIGIDLVAVFLGKLVRHAERLAVGDQHDADGR